MANFSENDLANAQTIIRNLFNRELQEVNIASNLPIADIETDIDTFITDLEILRDAEADVPAIRIGGELVPMTLRHFFDINNWNFLFPYPRYYRRSPILYEWIYELRYLMRDNRENGETLSHETARSTIERLAAEFLASRIASLTEFEKRGDSGSSLSFLNVFRRRKGPSISTPGCTFSVTANSPGLRVFWSGAYLISPKYFGSPTSPAISTLQSGTYAFGVDGGAYGNVIQWDQNAVVSLPGTPSVHLNY